MVFYKRNKFYAIAFILAGLVANASERIEVTADEFFADEVKQISILMGNVTIKKGDYDTLKSDKLTITFDKNKQPTKYTATGNANFKILLNDKHYDGKGGALTYTPASETYTLENNAYLHESESKKEVFGDKIVVNREKGTYEVKSGSGDEKKPIRLIFQVEDNK